MKTIKNVILVVFLLSIVSVNVLSQIPSFITRISFHAPGVVIPWDQYCATGSINFNFTYGYGKYEYWVSGIWFNGTQLSLNGNAATYSVCSPGNYQVKVTISYREYNDPVNGESGSNDQYQNVTVTKEIPPAPTVSISGPTEVSHAQSKYTPPNSYTWEAITNYNRPNAFTYTWTRTPIGGGNSASYSEGFGYNGAGGGSTTFNLSVQVQDNYGRSAFASMTVTEYYSGGIFDPKIVEESTNRSSVSIPVDFMMMQNYPNPFNPSTVISYQLPAVSNVSIKIFDALGREVAMLTNGVMEAGSYNATFKGANLPSGIYFARLNAIPLDGSKPISQTMKMLLAK